MSKCPDCGNEMGGGIKSNAIDDIRRCSPCFDKKREEIGLSNTIGGGDCMLKGTVGRIKEFQPYALENGPLYFAENDKYFDSGKGNKGKRCIHIQSKAHEDAVMKKMGCNFGEKGQEVLGFKLGYDKPEKKVHIRR